MRKDEGFVIESIATAYSGDWKPGTNPPDAYVRIVVLSWTCLMQSLRPFCPRGPTRSLLLTAMGSSAFGTLGRYVYSVIRTTRPCRARSISLFLSGCFSGIGMDTGG